MATVQGGVDRMPSTLPVHGHSAGVGWTGCHPHCQSMATVEGGVDGMPSTLPVKATLNTAQTLAGQDHRCITGL